MGAVTDNTVETFAALHAGGRIAVNYGGIRPYVGVNGEPLDAEGEPYEDTIRDHLDDEPPIGVYPLFLMDDRPGVWHVNWCAVDLDEGEGDIVHARNLRTLLHEFGVTAFIERSRSKGFHIWVYLQKPIPATLARESVIGACEMVDVPTVEVYPKQTTLEGQGYGNCLLLPYPNMRNPGRQEVLDTDDNPLSLEKFTETAWATRAATYSMQTVHSLYRERHVRKVNEFLNETGVGGIKGRDDKNFKFIARQIWDGDVQEDRSNALYAFACSLFRQNYRDDSVFRWSAALDEKIGKFVGRNDREKRLQELVTHAKFDVEHPRPQEGH